MSQTWSANEMTRGPMFASVQRSESIGAPAGPWPERGVNGMLSLPAVCASALANRPRLVLGALVVLAIGLSAWLFPRDIFLFHASWFLHPNEQEHLTISRHLADTGSLTIEDDWYGQSPAHGSEDKGYLDGKLVPRSSLVPYLMYAVPFLISDTAWTWVTPFFGLAAAVFAGLIVWQRTQSWLAGVAAALAMITTASVLLNASGLALENVIALAFLLGGVVALERFSAAPSGRLGALMSLMFALAAASRADVAPAGVIACGVLVCAYLRQAHQGTAAEQQLWGTVTAVTLFLAAVVLGLAFNDWMYGGPLKSGYGDQAWQGSAEGVGGWFLQFNLGDFKEMTWSFLFRIGKMPTSLLLIGLAWLAVRRHLRPGDWVLLGLSAVLVVLHLGTSTVTDGASPYLVNSPPRYMQPVYATGVVLGIAAAYQALQMSSLRRLTNGVAIALTALLLIVVSVNLSEAYGDTWAIEAAERDTQEFRQVHEFASAHEGALFVGDYNTKAVINGYTLIPRLLERPEQLPLFLKAELAAGRPVYIVDTPQRRDPSSGYYSGYLRLLEASDFFVSLVPNTPGFLQVTRPGWTKEDIASVFSALQADGLPDSLLVNPELQLTANNELPGWQANGEAWFVSAGADAVRIRNSAQYGGIRQALDTDRFASSKVTGIVAVRRAPDGSTAQDVVVGLYDDVELTPRAESYEHLRSGISYVVLETTIPAGSPPLRFVIASGRRDPGDFIIEDAIIVHASIDELLQTLRETQ